LRANPGAEYFRKKFRISSVILQPESKVKQENETPQKGHTQQRIRSPGTIPHSDNTTAATASLIISDTATAPSACVTNSNNAIATTACPSNRKPEHVRRNCSDASFSSARSSGKN